MPLDYDGGDKMNSDVSANALEHAASAKAATSYADEWKDELEGAAKARLQWRPEGYGGQSGFTGKLHDSAHGPAVLGAHPDPVPAQPKAIPPSPTADWGTEASRIGDFATKDNFFQKSDGTWGFK